MPIKYYDDGTGRYRKLPMVRVLFAANLLFAVATLVAWQSAVLTLLGPLTWATSQSVPFERDLGHLFEYPLMLFWLGPAVAMATASILIQARNYRAAFGVLAVPMLFLLLSVAMYWTVPNPG